MSLAKTGFNAVYIKKINTGIDTLVEQKLLMRRVEANNHEIGLNNEIWKLSPDTISLIREATTSIAESSLFDNDFCHTVNDVKKRFRKLGGARRGICDSAFDILVARFRATVLLRVNRGKKHDKDSFVVDICRAIKKYEFELSSQEIKEALVQVWSELPPSRN